MCVRERERFYAYVYRYINSLKKNEWIRDTGKTNPTSLCPIFLAMRNMIFFPSGHVTTFCPMNVNRFHWAWSPEKLLFS